MANNKMDILLDKVNFNSDCRIVAEYIINKYTNFDLEKVMKIAKYLMREKKYTKEDILTGKADEYLAKSSIMQTIANNSVRQKNENVSELKLRTKKEKLSRKELQALLKILGALVLIASAIGITYQNHMNDYFMEDVSDKIEILASEMPVADDMNYSYNELAAEKIINMCIENPDLFDVLVHDTYYKINDGHRLDSFTEIWNILQTRLANDESFEPIYSKIANRTFLSYVLNTLMINGKVDQNSKEYQKYIELISEFAKNPTYDAISKENGIVLKEMLKEYEELGLKLYKDSNKTITQEVKEMGARK